MLSSVEGVGADNAEQATEEARETTQAPLSEGKHAVGLRSESLVAQGTVMQCIQRYSAKNPFHKSKCFTLGTLTPSSGIGCCGLYV